MREDQAVGERGKVPDRLVRELEDLLVRDQRATEAFPIDDHPVLGQLLAEGLEGRRLEACEEVQRGAFGLRVDRFEVGSAASMSVQVGCRPREMQRTGQAPRAERGEPLVLVEDAQRLPEGSQGQDGRGEYGEVPVRVLDLALDPLESHDVVLHFSGANTAPTPRRTRPMTMPSQSACSNAITAA